MRWRRDVVKLAETNNPLSSGGSPDAARLLITRHAQTQSNVGGFFSGAADVGLSELGERQSADAVEAIVAWGPERVITSPLARCREAIAEPAAEALGISVEVDERIREFDFGPLEGVAFAEAAERGISLPWGPQAAHWPQVVADAGCGETMDDFIARLASAAAEFELLAGRTAIVCHGGVIRGLMHVWFGIGVETMNRLIVANVSSLVLRVRPGNVCLERFGLAPDELRALAASGGC